MQIKLSRRISEVVFACAIFLSAFLLFQVQPLISKAILPWFGGSPAVWTTCMLFFQLTLLVGYAYAHFISDRLTPRQQVLLHLMLVLTVFALLPITPNENWKPHGTDDPMMRIVMLLALCVGLPYFVLSANGPLLQRWFSHCQPGVGSSPYRLYALSNVGSLLALISYPFVVEPGLSVLTQAQVWSWSFVAFGVLCFLCGTRLWRQSSAETPKSSRVACEWGASQSIAQSESVSWRLQLLWSALAMVPSVMLLATTNQVCQDVASVPFLWVLPLTIYLLSFILCFDSERWYSRRIFTIALGISTISVCLILLKGSGVSIVAQIIVYFSALFFCCMVCHGELVGLKPGYTQLTRFYLLISAGGAAGGLFVGLIAPRLFPAFFELHFGLLACCAVTVFVLFRDKQLFSDCVRPRYLWASLSLFVLGIAVSLGVQATDLIGESIEISRNFYGVLRVEQEHRDNPQEHRIQLRHGNILHGMQFIAQDKRQQPTSYYGRDSGIGLLLDTTGNSHPKRVGVIGMGTGTLATYGKPGDYYRFYEINPDVVRLANRYFSFVKDSPAEIETVLGDARISLENDPPQRFDVLVLDAFSGDAIPAHLLTQEAADIYLRHLQPKGILAVHISNLHFDLRPVVAGLAGNSGLASVVIFTKANATLGTNSCCWMLLMRSLVDLTTNTIVKASPRPIERRLLWTDDHSNLFEILR